MERPRQKGDSKQIFPSEHYYRNFFVIHVLIVFRKLTVNLNLTFTKRITNVPLESHGEVKVPVKLSLQQISENTKISSTCLEKEISMVSSGPLPMFLLEGQPSQKTKSNF